MKVKVMKESGWIPALTGLALSYDQDWKDMWPVADKLANKDGGHNKFLESVCVWLDIDAPRYWWSQFDTYRIGVTKQSESTMHTVTKRYLTQDDFSIEIPSAYLDKINVYVANKDTATVKAMLPESFLQRRIVCTNYMALQRIIRQRYNHKLHEWRMFCDDVLGQCDYPEFLEETK